MPAEKPLDPVGEPEATGKRCETLAAGGTTTLSARFVHHSLEHYLEQISRARRTPVETGRRSEAMIVDATSDVYYYSRQVNLNAVLSSSSAVRGRAARRRASEPVE